MLGIGERSSKFLFHPQAPLTSKGSDTILSTTSSLDKEVNLAKVFKGDSHELTNPNKHEISKT
jgi:hypothetical protein